MTARKTDPLETLRTASLEELTRPFRPPPLERLGGLAGPAGPFASARSFFETPRAVERMLEAVGSPRTLADEIRGLAEQTRSYETLHWREIEAVSVAATMAAALPKDSLAELTTSLSSQNMMARLSTELEQSFRHGLEAHRLVAAVVANA